MSAISPGDGIPVMRFGALVGKNLRRRPLRSLLSTLGVALAICTVVSLLSVAISFESTATQVYQGHGVDLVVFRASVTERLTSSVDESIGEELGRLPGVAGVAPTLSDLVLLHGDSVVGMPLHGWRADCFLWDELQFVAGGKLQAADTHGVALGAMLAETLAKQAGDEVEIEGEAFTVCGVFRSSNVMENGSAIVPLATLQQLMDRAGQVTEFQIRLTSSGEQAHVAPSIPQHEPVPDDSQVASRMVDEVCNAVESLRDDQGRNLGLAGLPVQDFVGSNTRIRLAHALAWITSAIALAIGSIGLLNTMIMSVLERRQEIGVLRAIGWRKSSVVRLILGEAFALSLLGTVLGVGIAWLIVHGLVWLPQARGVLHAVVSPGSVATAAVLAVVFGLLGGAYPALHCARLSPTEALHYE